MVKPIRALFICAGHGLSATGAVDNGASGNGTNERQEVVQMALELYALLSADTAFSAIQITKIGVDSRLSLRQKIDQVNQMCQQNGWNSTNSLLLSIHLNSSSTPDARGIEAWYGQRKDDRILALTMVDAVSSVTGFPQRSRPVLRSDQNRLGRLGILDDTIPQAVLLEAGFISNQFDSAFIRDAALDDAFARGMHAGLRQYIGFNQLPKDPVEPPAQENFFTDVAPDSWYFADVKQCFLAGLFSPQPDGLFRPNQPVTRAELAVVIARHLQKHHSLS